VKEMEVRNQQVFRGISETKIVALFGVAPCPRAVRTEIQWIARIGQNQAEALTFSTSRRGPFLDCPSPSKAKSSPINSFNYTTSSPAKSLYSPTRNATHLLLPDQYGKSKTSSIHPFGQNKNDHHGQEKIGLLIFICQLSSAANGAEIY